MMWSIQLVLLSAIFAPSSGALPPAIYANLSRSFIPFPVPAVKVNHMPVNQNQWVCGGEMISESIAYYTNMGLCWEKMPEYNYCCAVHDSCYLNSVGSRENCDDEFCRCTWDALNGPVGKDERCEALKSGEETAYCLLVRKFGGSFYGKSKDESKVPINHPALNQTVIQEYAELYDACPGFKKPASVCAYNHMVCTLELLPKERYHQEYTDCREQLMTCLTESSNFLMKDHPKCLEQVEAVLEAVRNDAKVSGLDESLHWKLDVTGAPETTEDPSSEAVSTSTEEEEEEGGSPLVTWPPSDN